MLSFLRLSSSFPWPIAFLAMTILAATNGITATGMTVFDEALLTEFGWTRTELKVRDAVNFWGAALLLPIGGYAIDRWGVKPCTLTGLFILSGALFFYPQIDSLFGLYILHGFFAFALCLAGTMGMVILVSRHFVERRGLAVGIALAGTSLGGIIFTQLGAFMLSHISWRSAFQIEAVIPLVLLALTLVMVTRGGPVKDDDYIEPKDQGIGVAEALRTSAFWGIGLSGFITYGAILAIISNLFLFMRDLGASEREAATALSLLLGLALLGKFLSGMLSDYFSPYRLFFIYMSVMALGVAALFTMELSFVWFGIAVLGLGWGGIYTLYNYLVIKSFGLQAVGRIGSAVSVMESLGAGSGPMIAAFVFDRTGSYAGAFGGIFIGLLVALLLARLVKPPADKKTGHASDARPV